MKKKGITKLLSIILAVTMVFGFAVSPLASEGAVTYKSGEYDLTKISHPEKGSGEVDGIVDYVGNGAVSAKDEGQGDRGQNYAWSAIAYGDCVYVSTNYNSLGLTLGFMDSVLGNDFDPAEMNATLDVMYNGHFYTGEPDGANTGGVLTKINVKTNEVTVLMSKSETGHNVQLRNACEFNDKLYFCGSVNGLPKIIEVDPGNNDKCTIVYEGISQSDYYQAYLQGICTGIRGLCAYKDYLIVSMVTLGGAQILISQNPSAGQDAFTVIADQQELFDYPAYHFPDSIYGGSIWEMVEYNDDLYVSICTGTPDNKPDEYTMQSFALVKGEMGENAADWTWTPVIGNKADGAKYTFGIDPERTRAGAGVIYVYNDYLYIGEYNDEEIPLEHILFKADFTFMNRNLEQSVSLYRMDKNEDIELIMGDATKMFPEGGKSGLGSGFDRNENQYIWRMEEYNGKLYVGTFDTSSLLEPVGQFANGDLLSMTPSEWASLIGYIKTFVEISSASEDDGVATQSLSSEDTDDLTYLYSKYTVDELAKMASDKVHGKAARIAPQSELALSTLIDTLEGFMTTANYMIDAERGFDLYVTEDGINFETITTNGFNDPYNHGLRTFAAMDDGLMIGTANPFYACQVWMLTDGNEVEKDTFADIMDSIFGDIFRYIITWVREITLLLEAVF
ncbi:MAG: hypothetical protein IJD78_07350 [Clostridia bacterium]|nr:hypothetical protein [Clostridia bacterium]MBQ3044370.1 hypothetical protein [Clostridia bacterium]